MRCWTRRDDLCIGIFVNEPDQEIASQAERSRLGTGRVATLGRDLPESQSGDGVAVALDQPVTIASGTSTAAERKGELEIPIWKRGVTS